MRYTREYLLDFLEILRDEMMNPMHPFERSKWVAERAVSINGVVTLARNEIDESKVKQK